MSSNEEKLRRLNIRIRRRGSSWQANFKMPDGSRKQRQSGDKEALIETCIKMIEHNEVLSVPKPAVQPELDVALSSLLMDAYREVCQTKWHGDLDRGGLKDWKLSRRRAEEAITFFGQFVHPKDITTPEIKRYQKHLVDDLGNSGSTVNRKVSALMQVLRSCAELGFIQSLPYTSRHKEGKPRDFVIDLELERQILAFFKGEGNVPAEEFVVLGIETGCRVGELMGLGWSNVDLEKGELRLSKGTTKNGEARTVPLKDASYRILLRRRDYLPSPFGDFSVSRLKLAWGRMKLALGLKDEEDFVPHSMRHTCATRMAESGVSTEVRMHWLGHKSHAMAKRYEHMGTSVLHGAVVQMEDARRQLVTQEEERKARLQRLRAGG